VCISLSLSSILRSCHRDLAGIEFWLCAWYVTFVSRRHARSKSNAAQSNGLSYAPHSSPTPEAPPCTQEGYQTLPHPSLQTCPDRLDQATVSKTPHHAIQNDRPIRYASMHPSGLQPSSPPLPLLSTSIRIFDDDRPIGVQAHRVALMLTTFPSSCSQGPRASLANHGRTISHPTTSLQRSPRISTASRYRRPLKSWSLTSNLSEVFWPLGHRRMS
jgi:hypothetical protein